MQERLFIFAGFAYKFANVAPTAPLRRGTLSEAILWTPKYEIKSFVANGNSVIVFGGGGGGGLMILFLL
jgi:hypothetical protein